MRVTRPGRFAFRTFAVLAFASAAGFADAQPMQLPGAQPFNPAGAQQSAPASPAGAAAKPRPPSMPAIRVAGEEAITGRVLRRNGGFGEANFEKTAAGYGLKLNLAGFQSSNLTEPCAVSFGDTPVPVTAQGRPAGVPRYKLEALACPIVFDVLDGAFLVVEPAQPCVIEAAACRVDPRGLWGPDSRNLTARAKEIEAERSRADKAVREGFRALTAKAEATDQRTIAREQASFTSEREQICRDFQRESAIGFCATRFTEARAASIRARLGITTEAKPEGAKPDRPRRPAVARPAPPPPVLPQ